MCRGRDITGRRLVRVTHREAQPLPRFVVAQCDRLRERADASDISRALRHGDCTARIELVEGVRGLQHLLVGWKRELRFHQALRAGFVVGEVAKERRGIGMLEVIGRLLDLVLMEDIAIRELLCPSRRRLPFGPHQVVDVLDALQIHRQSLKPVRDLSGNRFAVESADLLKIGELRDLHAIQPHFPSETPRAERRVLPVVLDEAHIVLREVQPDRFERADIKIDDVLGRRLEDYLKLVVVLHAIRVLAIAPVLGAARGLNVRGAPWLGADGAKERRRVRRARAHFHVERLQQRALLAVPVLLQREDDLLKRQHEDPVGKCGRSRVRCRASRVRFYWFCC